MREVWMAGLVVICLQPQLAWGADAASVAAPTLQPGDAWIYQGTRERAPNRFAEGGVELKVERIDSDTMVVGIKLEGSPADFQDHLCGTDWSQRRLVDGREEVTGRPFSFPLAIGKTWSADYVDPTVHDRVQSARSHTTYRVVGWQNVTTPSGTWRALEVEADGTIAATLTPAASAVSGSVVTGNGGTTVTQMSRSAGGVDHHLYHAEFYYVPQVKYFVKSVEEEYNSENVRISRNTRVLVSFTPAAGAGH